MKLCALCGRAVLPVVQAVQADDGVDGCVGIVGQIALPGRVVGGQPKERRQVSARRRTRCDDEVGITAELGDIARAQATAALTSVI